MSIIRIILLLLIFPSFLIADVTYETDDYPMNLNGLDANNSTFHWFPIEDNTIPNNAFVALKANGKKFIVCQTSYAGVLVPGLLIPKGCLITFGEKAHLMPIQNILTSNENGYWFGINQSYSKNIQNNDPYSYGDLGIVGGQNVNDGSNVYICRTTIFGRHFIGKVDRGLCYIAIGKYEASWPTYEVLLRNKP